MGSNDRKTPFRLVEDGLPYDDVPHVTASEEQLRSFERAAEQMRQFKAPALWDPKDRHSYMLFGLLDGTGNDVNQDPLHPTNVARLREQIKKLNASGVDNVVAEYLPGPGTQINAITNPLDGATGATALDRAEEMYWRLVRQAQIIYRNDPDAKINIHLEGFSRGASTVPMVARLIDERGIPDLDRPVLVQDASGKTISTFPHLLKSPGQTPMSVGLYDPVPTGIQEFVDRRLPPSVVSGFQINSADELRKPFPVDRIIPQGLSADGRFLSVTVSGVHADVGGWYLRSGLADRSMNLMTDFRNALASKPLFQRLHETDDPRLNVVHQSHTNWKFRYTGIADRASPAGEVTRLVPDMTHIAPPGQVVHVYEQAPEPANGMAKRLHAQARPVELTPHVGSPRQTSADGLMARLARDPNVELQPYSPAKSMSSGTKAAIGGVAINAVLTGIEWSETYQRVQVFRQTLGNDTAARDAYVNQGAQTVGTAVGGVAGTGVAIALGTGSGGTFILVAGSAYLAGKAAEKAVTIWQNDRIYTQTDRDGVEWEFNGRQWIRDDLRADLVTDGVDTPHKKSFSALPDKVRELNYLASVEAVGQALGKVPEPGNPLMLAPNDSDMHSLRTRHWMYQAESGKWVREIVTDEDHRGVASRFKHIEADTERAAQLSAQAMHVIDENLRTGPAVLAARYQVVFKAYGYGHEGEAPAAIAKALSPDLLQASDGKYYQRDEQGKWAHEGEQAPPSRALELELTRERLVPALEQHQEQLARMPAWQPLTPEQRDRENLRLLYADNTWNLNPDQFEATYAAVQRTRAEHGIGPESTSLALDLDAEGKRSIVSPIMHLRKDTDGVVRIAATTFPEKIAPAQSEAPPVQRDDGAPMQAALERTIIQATPEQRDAREQALREANRQGLSQVEAQQVAQAAVMGASADVMAPVGAVTREVAAEAEETQRAQRERALETLVAQDGSQAAAVAAMTRDAHNDETARPEREHTEDGRTARDSEQLSGAQLSNVREPEHTSPAGTVADPSGHERTPEQQPAIAKSHLAASQERPHETSLPTPVDRELQESNQSSATRPAADNSDALRPGDRNDQVELLQYRLDRHGYRGPDDQPIPQNGRYDPETEHAVRQFQQDRGLPVTGTADLATQYEVAQTRSTRVELPEAVAPEVTRAIPDVRIEQDPTPTLVRTGGSTRHGGQDHDDQARDLEGHAKSVRAPSVEASEVPASVAAGSRAASAEREDELEQDRSQSMSVREATGQREAMQGIADVAPVSQSFDPRHPEHPDHGMYLCARDKVADLYERHGIPIPEEKLERTTAAVLSDARANKMTQIEAIEFTATQKFGTVPDTQGKLVAWSHDPAEKVPWSKASLTDQQSIDVRDPDREYARFREETINEQLSLEEFQKKQEEINQNPPGPVMTMGARALSLAMTDSSSSGDAGGGDG